MLFVWPQFLLGRGTWVPYLFLASSFIYSFIFRITLLVFLSSVRAPWMPAFYMDYDSFDIEHINVPKLVSIKNRKPRVSAMVSEKHKTFLIELWFPVSPKVQTLLKCMTLWNSSEANSVTSDLGGKFCMEGWYSNLV